MLGLHYLDWLVLALYFVGTTGLGIWTMKKVRSSGDYFMGGRGFGKVMMIAQAFGVGTHTDQPVSVTGAAYSNGLAGIWYQWIYLFSTPFFWIIAPIYRRLRYITMADFFQHRYGTPIAMLYTGVALLYFSMNMGIMLKGTAVTVEGLTGGALEEDLVIIVATGLFVTYGVAGGLIAAVYTDLIQGVLILLLSFMLIPSAIQATGGMGVFHENLPEHMFSLIAPEELTLAFIIAAVINGLVHVVVLPHHMAIGGSGKTEIACRTGWTYGNFLKRFATVGWAFTGVFAAFLIPGLSDAERELSFGLMSRELLPIGFVGLMLAAMIAAVMSTCDAFMVHASALFTHNLYRRYLNPAAGEDKLLRVARWSSFTIVLGGLLFAYGFPTVIQGIKELWKITAYMGIAFWMGILWRGANRWGALTSALAMFASGTITGWLLDWSFAAQVALYVPVGIVMLVVVSLFTTSEAKAKLDAFYLLLDTPVGKENRLRRAGVEILLAGDADEKESDRTDQPSSEDDGLILVDLQDILTGKRRFSWKRYRMDLIGFSVACLVAAGTIAIVWIFVRLAA